MKIYNMQRELNTALTERFLEYPTKSLDLWDHQDGDLRRLMHEISMERLFFVNGIKGKDKEDLVLKILRLYDGRKQKYPEVSSDAALSLAHDLIAMDLLTLMLIDQRGNPTEIAREKDWIVNPMNYIPSKRPWTYLDNLMVRQLKEAYRKDGNEYTVETEEIDSLSQYINLIISDYQAEFGKSSLLIVPNTIHIWDEGVEILPLRYDISPEDWYPVGTIYFPMSSVEIDGQLVRDPEIRK